MNPKAVTIHAIVEMAEEEIITTWKKFTDFYGKNFKSEEDEIVHFNQFEKSIRFISNHSSSSFSVGLTQFSDWTEFELQRHFSSVTEGNFSFDPLLSSTGVTIPDSINWSSLDNPLHRVVVTSVKDQLQCGACWYGCDHIIT